MSAAVYSVPTGTANANGARPYSYIAAASANQDAQVVKAAAGQVYGLSLFNTSAAARYVKFYNKATAPTSADTPVLRAYLPAGGGAVVPIDIGVAFDAGISFRITTGYADNDANAATAGDVLVNAAYR
jgi:hypothetical protein